MADQGRHFSIVEYFYKPNGPSEGECGYCFEKKDVSYGVWAHRMDSELYSTLYLHGWSRVGKYVFKQVNERTCCPQYAISCDAANFVLSKSQKKTLIKFCRYLETDSVKETSEKEEKGQALFRKQLAAKEQRVVNQDEDPVIPETPADVSTNLTAPNKQSSSASVRQRVVHKKPDAKNIKKTVSEFISVNEPMIGRAHRLDVNWIKLTPPSPELQWTINEAYLLYRRYRAVVHNKKESDEECRRDFQARCLDSPFLPAASLGRSVALEYGTYHCHYYLDGRLFMVGVVDYMPSCFISVYLYYDPEYRFLSPGTFSALYEIAFVQRLARSDPSLQHYCMDQYVHSTPKMSYKRKFCPSYLLCTLSHTWHPIEDCIAELEQSRCAYFSVADKNRGPAAIASDDPVDVDNVPILLLTHQGKETRQSHRIGYIFLRVLLGRNQEKIDAMVKDYVRVVGSQAASKAYLLITSEILQKLIDGPQQ